MGMNDLINLEACLQHSRNEIFLPEEIIQKARVPLERMIQYKR